MMDQILTDRSWADTYSSRQPEQSAFPLSKNTWKVLGPDHAKDPVLWAQLVLVPALLYVTPASDPFSLKLPKGTSTYPPSPKYKTQNQTHQCPNPACCPEGGRKNFTLQNLGWVPGTSPPLHQLADMYDSVRGLIASCQVVMAWRRIVESCLQAWACWQREEEQDWMPQSCDYRLECFRHKRCQFQDEDHDKKDQQYFWKGWSLTVVAQSWLVHASVHCKLTKGERRPEPMWTYQMIHFCPLQKAESCSFLHPADSLT